MADPSPLDDYPLAPKDRLLLSFLGGAAASLSGRSLSADEWHALLRDSVRHLVAPVIYRRLRTIDFGVDVPPGILRGFQQAYLQNSADNLRIFHELGKVLSILNEAGIPVIPLKGAHLSFLVYPQPALRPMVDADLLFKKTDLDRAQRALLGAGYLRPESPLSIDVHWNLNLSTVKTSIDMEGVWQRARPATIAGGKVHVLSPEDLLLHLCIHIALHHIFQGGALRTFCDIGEILHTAGNSVDFALLTDRARRWGVIPGVHLALLLSRGLVGAAIPGDALKTLAATAASDPPASWAVSQIFSGTPAPVHLSPYFWQMWGPYPLREKASFLLRLLLPRREYLSQKFPVRVKSGTRFLYYLVRAKENVSPYLWFAWRLLLRDGDTKEYFRSQKTNFSMRRRLVS